jgi:hypothetical protein
MTASALRSPQRAPGEVRSVLEQLAGRAFDDAGGDRPACVCGAVGSSKEECSCVRLGSAGVGAGPPLWVRSGFAGGASDRDGDPGGLAGEDGCCVSAALASSHVFAVTGHPSRFADAVPTRGYDVGM